MVDGWTGLAYPREQRADFSAPGVRGPGAGSSQEARYRFANQPAGTPLTGPFEIVSLVGAFTRDGGHLHIALSDGKGATIGGHLMPGSAVYTTAEIVLVELQDLAFSREKDNETTYDELVVRPRK